jgi:drug/metabolite transporter (DMT)-like permease
VSARHKGDIRTATLIGYLAIPIWSTLAILTTRSGEIPPFQLVGMAFTTAFIYGIFVIWRKGLGMDELRKVPWRAWVLGVGGLFGYHFLYFLAFRLAPPVEVNLLNYLWPLLIVFFSVWILRQRLTLRHIVGVLLGILGAGVLITHGKQVVIQVGFIDGYLAAFGAAVIWAGYSVLNRQFVQVPTEMVGICCGVTALLAYGGHLIFEQSISPQGTQWLIVAAMGIGPVGSAFYFWDYGVKRGDLRALGAGAYIIPFLSTGLLIVFGEGALTTQLMVAGTMIVLGAIVAGWDVLRVSTN